MAGKCKYCGFVGTQDEIVDHAGEMCHGDCQPDIAVKNLTDNQQANTAICGTCGGSGVVDSGGQEPWGQFINIPCPECRKQQ